MPTGVYIKRKPIRSKYAGKILNDEIRGELKRLGDLAVATYLQPATQYWSDLGFAVNAQATATKVLLTIKPTGPQLAKDRWKMVDKKGRKGGVTITAKNPSGVMRFQSGYARKTGLAVSSFGVSPGSRFGNWVSTPSVVQGAIEPLGITEKMKKELIDPYLDKDIRNAYRRALYKIKRAG